MECEGNSSTCPDESGSDKAPYEYYGRFSLCVLDIIRKLQQYPLYSNGLRECHILEHLKNIRTLDGDIEEQLKSALHQLETSGLIMFVNQSGYQTMGPHVKICSSKTLRQRKQAWENLDSTLNGSSSQQNSFTNHWNYNLANSTSNNNILPLTN